MAMKRTLGLLLLAGMIVFGSGASYAHHSFSATYYEDKEQTIEGEMVQFMYRNPHSFVHVMAPDASKQTVRWAIEWGGGGQLSRQGISRETLKYGDHVIVTGSPGRNPDDHRLRLKTIYRPRDGWKWGGVVE
jgi:hypothetical protein